MKKPNLKKISSMVHKTQLYSQNNDLTNKDIKLLVRSLNILNSLINKKLSFIEKAKKLDLSEKLPITIVVIRANDYKLTEKAVQKITEILNNNSRQEDIISQVNQNEYNLLLPQTNYQIAHQVINRIKKSYQKIKINPSKPNLTFSFATKSNSEQDIEQIIERARNKNYTN